MNEELIRIIEQSNSEDLCEAQRMIPRVLDERRNKAQETAWNNFVTAFKEYTVNFGSIGIITDESIFYMNSLDDFSSIGTIEVIVD